MLREREAVKRRMRICSENKNPCDICLVTTVCQYVSCLFLDDYNHNIISNKTQSSIRESLLYRRPYYYK